MDKQVQILALGVYIIYHPELVQNSYFISCHLLSIILSIIKLCAFTISYNLFNQ